MVAVPRNVDDRAIFNLAMPSRRTSRHLRRGYNRTQHGGDHRGRGRRKRTMTSSDPASLAAFDRACRRRSRMQEVAIVCGPDTYNVVAKAVGGWRLCGRC